MYTVKTHKHVKYLLQKCKKIVYILYLDYVLFIWRKLDGCIYIHLSYC